MKKLVSLLMVLMILFVYSCAVNDLDSDNQTAPAEEARIDAQLNAELSKVMEVYAKAATTNDPATVAEFQAALQNFDEKYGTDLLEEFNSRNTADINRSSIGGGSDYPALTDLPISMDGMVYVSGGSSNAVSSVITFVQPKSTRGAYFHGAVLDYNKFDPTNLETQCFQTAVLKGAGYETAMEWMKKPNVAVFKPKTALNAAGLNQAQQAMHYYCDPNNKNMQYGFFKDYANIFSLVSKSDNYYWYCTKVVWRVYNALGINLDSNSSQVDWTTSGLYSFVKAYYKTIYFWSSSKANSKINEYMNNARSTIVLAEEIYYSPYLTKVYENIRDPQ